MTQVKQNKGIGMVSTLKKSVQLMATAALLGVSVLGSAKAATDEVVYFHTDALGSPVVAFSAAGEVCWTETYSPYGEKLDKEDSLAPEEGCGLLGTDVGYTGHVQDGSGLVYAQQRYYDPVVGRFMSTDPVLPDVGGPRYFGRYQYGVNNPYKYVDPDGASAVIGLGPDQDRDGIPDSADNDYIELQEPGFQLGELAGAALAFAIANIVMNENSEDENPNARTPQEDSLQDSIRDDIAGGRELTPEEVDVYTDLAGELGLHVDDDRGDSAIDPKTGKNHWKKGGAHIHIGRGQRGKVRTKRGDSHIPAESTETNPGNEGRSDGNGGVQDAGSMVKPES